MKLHASLCIQRTIARLSATVCAVVMLAAILFSCALGSRALYAGEDGDIHWASVAEAQVKIDQTTPLTWGAYQAEKKGKPDKKFSNLVLLLVGHRYLLVELKSKRVYEVPRKELHAQGDGVDSGDLLADANLVPTSDWIWRDVGPADLYRVTLDDYGRVLQLTLPHPYLISPY
ncbi:MAG: hypothetical protein ACRD3S_18265, partial [Terracidiphilus sp.]